MASEFAQQIWSGLLADIKNEFGVAGLMGNLQAESGLIPYRVQGDFSNGYADSIAYTQQVDNGTVTESQFVNREQGYGLAQWTFYTRKQGLYDMKQSMGVSIGSVELGVAYLLHELKTDYSSIYNTLVNAKSINEASDIVLFDFESPADQSQDVVEERRALGVGIYNELSGSIDPGSGGSGNIPTTNTKKKKYNFVLFKQRQRIITSRGRR